VKLPVLFSEAFDSPIWELHLNDDHILISMRNQDKHEVSFSLFNLSTLTFLWKSIVFEEPWWIGVTLFSQDMIVFHTYSNSKDIEEKSIFAYNWKDTEVVWAFSQFNPVQLYKDSLVCSKLGTQKKELVHINLKDGSELVIDELPKQDERKSEPLISNLSQNPLHYVEGTAAFESVAKFLKLKFKIKIFGACDYLEHQGGIVISYFQNDDNDKINRLIVLDKNLEMLDSLVLDPTHKGLASDTFFIVDEALIFVKNRSQLMGLLIRNK